MATRAAGSRAHNMRWQPMSRGPGPYRVGPSLVGRARAAPGSCMHLGRRARATAAGTSKVV